MINKIIDTKLKDYGYNIKYKDHKLKLIYIIRKCFKLAYIKDKKYELERLIFINTKISKIKKYKFNIFVLLLSPFFSSID